MLQSAAYWTAERTPGRVQARVGLTLAGTIFALWAALQVYSLFFLDLAGWRWALVPALFVLQTWFSVGLFIVAHDAMHGSLAPGQPRLNAAVGGFILFVYAGFSFAKMRAAHFDHHNHAGRTGDPDFAIDSPRGFWRWYAIFLRRYFGWQSLAYVIAVNWLLVLAFGAPVTNVVLLYALPSIASSLQLFYFGTFLPHRHNDDGFPDRHNARTSHFGYVASLASCFHFGYHHEHHLAPQIPWWGLPRRYRARMAAVRGER